MEILPYGFQSSLPLAWSGAMEMDVFCMTKTSLLKLKEKQNKIFREV